MIGIHFVRLFFLCKVRGAAVGYTHLETQPFSRSFAGQDWVFLHNGDLDKSALKRLCEPSSLFLEPLGQTDSEMAFCYLLARVQDYGARQIAEIDPNTLYGWFLELDKLGSADIIFSDGISVCAFLGTHSESALYHTRLKPPHTQVQFESEAASFDLKNPRDTYRAALVFHSRPMTPGQWSKMAASELVIARRAQITYSSTWQAQAQPQQTDIEEQPAFTSQMAQAQQLSINNWLLKNEPNQKNLLNVRSLTHAPDGTRLGYKLLEVNHTTEYAYERPVEHSTHIFRLMPLDDSIQEVISSTLSLSCEGDEFRCEDVFGNHVIHYDIRKPYEKLSLTCRSVVRIYGQAPDDLRPLLRHTMIPPTMMPWQRAMMDPYLLPMEMPESQLLELHNYAMSFSERNGRFLVDTLNDINLTLYRDFAYSPGETSLSTTPFEIYASRRGVCQDFANLFICLARLLGVPARYRMGYIRTGSTNDNQVQSEASHAWAEIYIPYIGWRGFDPTNGCRVGQDHVRVACGRNYLDATPTSGTIFRGGGKETLFVRVALNEIIL